MQMQGKISMDLSFCLSENGFSLDELVIKLADVFERRAFAELLRLILQLTQEVLMSRLFAGKGAVRCCENSHLRLNGRLWDAFAERPRRIQNELLARPLFFLRQKLCSFTTFHSSGLLTRQRLMSLKNSLSKLLAKPVIDVVWRSLFVTVKPQFRITPQTIWRWKRIATR